jgi:hypothetical protein
MTAVAAPRRRRQSARKRASVGQRRPSEAEPKTYGDVVSEYRWHEEAKSLAPDGQPCTAQTTGLLQRMPVRAAATFECIGKETDRRWEREDDISLLNPRLVRYRPQESAKLTAEPDLLRAPKASATEQERAEAFATGTANNQKTIAGPNTASVIF